MSNSEQEQPNSVQPTFNNATGNEQQKNKRQEKSHEIVTRDQVKSLENQIDQEQVSTYEMKGPIGDEVRSDQARQKEQLLNSMKSRLNAKKKAKKQFNRSR